MISGMNMSRCLATGGARAMKGIAPVKPSTMGIVGTDLNVFHHRLTPAKEIGPSAANCAAAASLALTAAALRAGLIAAAAAVAADVGAVPATAEEGLGGGLGMAEGGERDGGAVENVR